MSATTDPAASAVEAAPPPPGTVVWSIFIWTELLRDGPWLEARWAPVNGALVGDRRLPDAQGTLLQGRSGQGEAAVRLPADERGAPACTVPVVPLGLYMIR